MLVPAEVVRPGTDMLDVPITALGRPSRELLCALLDPEKVIPSARTRGHPRDWRGLAALAMIPGQLRSGIYNSKDCPPTEKVLRLWSQRKDNTATVGKLQEFLQALDRWDIYDETFELFAEDVRVYSKQQENTAVATWRGELDAPPDLITCHDVALSKSGSREVQRYSAYVLYAKEDFAFACKMIKELRGRGHSVCCEEDLLAGFTTEMSPVTRLISERCEHMIVIFSQDFLKSTAMKFYTDYAQALGISTNTRKLVPCMYRYCVLPPSYSFYHMLHYQDKEIADDIRGNFWERLSQSIEVVTQLPRVQITEVDSCEESSRDLKLRATCSANSPAVSRSASPSMRTASPEPDSLELPSPPADVDSLTSGSSMSTLNIQKKPNPLKKIYKQMTSKLKRRKANQVFRAVSSAV